MSGFLAELKRRHVARVAVVYVAVAFAVLQGADVLVPALHLPTWITTTVAILAILGFPIALVLAWAFEITPDGVKRTDDVPVPTGRVSWVSGRTIAVVAIALVLTAATGWFAGRLSAPSAEAESLRSVAVLPFANLSDDPQNEYFSDGLAEELLNVLAQVKGLKVAARTSAFAFRGKDVDVREVGRALGVETVVEGSVRRQENRVRVTAQLIKTSNGFHMWSKTYEGALADVFALQDSLAQAIAAALQMELGLGQSMRERGMTTDIAAYDLYLLGRQQWAQRTPEGTQNARKYFEAAIERDSTFALAYSGLADLLLVVPFYDFRMTFPQAATAARPFVERALALTPDRGEVQATAGLLAYYGDWDFERALRHMNRAIELAPGHAWVYHYRRQVLTSLDRRMESLRDARKAVELDPLSPIMWGGNLALSLLLMDSAAASIPAFERALLNWQAPPFVIRFYADALLELGRVREAERAFIRWAESLRYARPEAAIAMAHAHESADAARKVKAMLDDIVATTPAKRSDLALEYWRTGRETAIEVATETVDERNIWALYLNTLGRPPHDLEFRADPRFVALLKRVGLPALN